MESSCRTRKRVWGPLIWGDTYGSGWPGDNDSEGAHWGIISRHWNLESSHGIRGPKVDEWNLTLCLRRGVASSVLPLISEIRYHHLSRASTATWLKWKVSFCWSFGDLLADYGCLYIIHFWLHYYYCVTVFFDEPKFFFHLWKIVETNFSNTYDFTQTSLTHLYLIDCNWGILRHLLAKNCPPLLGNN